MNVASLGQRVVATQQHHAHGWTVSALIHAMGIGTAVMLMAERERPALPQPFRFDVALVQRSASQSVSEPVPAEIPSQPPVPQRTVAHRVQAKRVVASAQTLTRVRQDIVAVPAAIARPPAQQMTVQHVKAVHESGESITQPLPTSMTTGPRHVVTQMPAIEHESIMEQATSDPVSRPALERPAQVERERTVELAPSIQRAEVVAHESANSVPTSPGIEPRLVTQRVMQSLPQAQADYGWLAESLWTRIEQLKRYPSQAKAHHWEGKVILEAVIREDGTIMELRIEESSGHAILDQDALAVVKKASPLALKHSLGQPHITILVPISYNLEN
jgi:protein TonB